MAVGKPTGKKSVYGRRVKSSGAPPVRHKRRVFVERPEDRCERHHAYRAGCGCGGWTTLGLIIVLAVLALIGLVAFAQYADRAGCAERWRDRETRWSAYSGCVVELEPGRWVPEGAVRVLHNRIIHNRE